MNFASDHGYVQGFSMACKACGSNEMYCCDGHGKRLSFGQWGKALDTEICKIEETERNEIEAPYADFYASGLTVWQAIEKIYNG